MDGIKMYLTEKKALEIFEECMDEMYKASTPSISWKAIKTKYSGKERSEFYLKHYIDADVYYSIKKKYMKRLNIFYRRSLDWFLLDYAPTFSKGDEDEPA